MLVLLSARVGDELGAPQVVGVVVVGVGLLVAGIALVLVVEPRRDAGLADVDVLALPYARAGYAL